jgi:pyruvate formate lyase activating enzyme
MAESQIGLCGIRQNVGGKLQLLAYGKLFTGHIDPIEKKPVTHYHPGTRIFSVATSGCSWLCHPRGTQILLAGRTTKNIEDIVPGDMVWSYDLEQSMKIEPNVVTHTGTRFAEVLEIRFGKNRNNVLLLTEEHPVLTPSGWKQAKALTHEDSLVKVWAHTTNTWMEKHVASIKNREFICKNCSKTLVGITSWNQHRGACYTEGIEKSEEVLAKYRKRMKENNPMFDQDTARRALAASKERFISDPTHGWHRNAERLRIWLHRHPSASQLGLYGILNEMGIRYEKEFRITLEKKLTGSKSCYVADAAIPDIKLDIEADGWWHYHNEGVMKQDKIRDDTLRANGWDVLRIGGSDLLNHPEQVKILFSQKIAMPVMTNTRMWLPIKSVRRTGRTEQVFGIETIPNHNYVADSVIVHNCKYCQNYDISQRRKIEGFDIEPIEVPKLALAQGCQGIAYTYNEPSIFIEFARDIGREAHKKGLFNIFVSNGYDTPESVSMMSQFLDCITVDFKGNAELEFVRKYIGIPSPEPIFETLLEIKKKTKIHIEITDLIVPKVGDNLEHAKKLSKWVYDNLGPQMPMHFLRFHPDYKMMEFPNTPIPTLEAHHKVAKEVGLEYVYLGNVPGHPLENTYCHGCGEVVVERYGYDITGWHLDKENKCQFCGAEVPIEGGLASTVREERFLRAYF